MVAPTPFRRAEFKSNYGPKYTYQPTLMGLNGTQAIRLALKTGAFGAALGTGALLFTSGIPRIQTDILSKLPFMSQVYVKEIHPADNPF